MINWNFSSEPITKYGVLGIKINEFQEIIRHSLFETSIDNDMPSTRKLIYVCLDFSPLNILSHFGIKCKGIKFFFILIFCITKFCIMFTNTP